MLNKLEFRSQKSVVGSTLVMMLFTFLFTLNTQAQCAMCRASLETEGNETKAEAINDGIVFLMAIPYILVAVIGIVVYRMYRKR
jgi:heme/copper-type cytochrome/quinol oxidase subunit 2